MAKTPEEKAAKKAELEQARKVYSTLEEAKANPPTGDRAKWIIHSVTDPNGKVVYIWSFGRDAALLNVVKSLGWKSSSQETPVTKERVASLMAKLPESERNALLSAFAGDHPPTPPETAPEPALPPPVPVKRGRK